MRLYFHGKTSPNNKSEIRFENDNAEYNPNINPIKKNTGCIVIPAVKNPAKLREKTIVLIDAPIVLSCRIAS